MKKIILVLAVVVLVVLSSCGSSSVVPYTHLEKYFVKNTYETPAGGALNNVMTTQDQFDNVFGAATVMGTNGKPTAVDFAKQFVVYVVGQETDVKTEYAVGALTQPAAGKLNLEVKKTEGEKQSFTTRPVLLIAVDKKYEGAVSVTVK